MQDPNEDTQWNDILRSKGIIPPKKEKEIKEDDIVNLLESTVLEKTNIKESIEEEDEDYCDDEALEILRAKYRRMAELAAAKNKYGDVLEISAVDYVKQINEAGPEVYVVLHLYERGITLCALINQHLKELADKFKSVKFVKTISSTCIPNYPDWNLPTIFIYYEGSLVKKFVGPEEFRPNLTVEELEWMLGKAGAVKTEMKEDPRPRIKDVLFSQLQREADDWA